VIGFLKGKKSYVLGAGWVLWGIWTYTVEGDPATGFQHIMEGIGLITLRAGVKKSAAVVSIAANSDAKQSAAT
jgi:hypothetical protein